MGHKLYWVDSYGKVHRDKKAEKAQGGGSWTRPFMLALIAFAIIMVLASMIH